jgi:hypothetical protein
VLGGAKKMLPSYAKLIWLGAVSRLQTPVNVVVNLGRLEDEQDSVGDALLDGKYFSNCVRRGCGTGAMVGVIGIDSAETK